MFVLVASRALVAQLLDVHELLLAGAVRLAVERATDTEQARALTLSVLGTVALVMRRLRPPHAELEPALAVVREALERRDPAGAEQGIRALLRLEREFALKELDRETAEAGAATGLSTPR